MCTNFGEAKAGQLVVDVNGKNWRVKSKERDYVHVQSDSGKTEIFANVAKCSLTEETRNVHKNRMDCGWQHG